MDRAEKQAARVAEAAGEDAPAEEPVEGVSWQRALLDLGGALDYPNLPIARGNGETFHLAEGNEAWIRFAVGSSQRDCIVALGHVAILVSMLTPAPDPAERRAPTRRAPSLYATDGRALA